MLAFHHFGQLQSYAAVTNQGLGYLGKRTPEPFAQHLGLADVSLGGVEVRMTSALLNAQRLVASDGHPRDARRPQVVEAQPLDRRRRREETPSLDARGAQPGPHVTRQVPPIGQV
ncbi:MAG TPA: hypothetical protein VKP30_04770 [Polyangiaceae bacterium]|nr:hypothetical protein [Polyangiaceae bacterium]